MVIYDDLVAESLTDPPLPAEPAEPVAELPPAVHDATACSVCKAWLAHIRDAEAR